MYDSWHYLMKLYKSQNVEEMEKTKSFLKLWIENQHEENISVLKNKEKSSQIYRSALAAATLLLSKLQSTHTMKYHIAINK